MDQEIFDDLERQERWLIEQIESYTRGYEKTIKPYLDRLAQIQSWKPTVFPEQFKLNIPEIGGNKCDTTTSEP